MSTDIVVRLREFHEQEKFTSLYGGRHVELIDEAATEIETLRGIIAAFAGEPEPYTYDHPYGSETYCSVCNADAPLTLHGAVLEDLSWHNPNCGWALARQYQSSLHAMRCS